MAAPVLEEITRKQGTASNIAYFDMPTTVNAGDLLLVSIMWDSNINDTGAPTGYTELAIAATRGLSQWVGYKSADGTEDGANLSIGHSGGSEHYASTVHRFQAGTWDTPELLTDQNANGVTGYTFTAKNGALATLYAYVGTLWVDADPPTHSSGTASEGAATIQDPGSAALVDWCDIETTEGSSPAMTFTWTSDGYHAVLVGIPAPVAGDPDEITFDQWASNGTPTQTIPGDAAVGAVAIYSYRSYNPTNLGVTGNTCDAGTSTNWNVAVEGVDSGNDYYDVIAWKVLETGDPSKTVICDSGWQNNFDSSHLAIFDVGENLSSADLVATTDSSYSQLGDPASFTLTPTYDAPRITYGICGENNGGHVWNMTPTADATNDPGQYEIAGYLVQADGDSTAVTMDLADNGSQNYAAGLMLEIGPARITANSGSYTLTGQDIGLDYSGGIELVDYQHVNATGTVTIPADVIEGDIAIFWYASGGVNAPYDSGNTCSGGTSTGWTVIKEIPNDVFSIWYSIMAYKVLVAADASKTVAVDANYDQGGSTPSAGLTIARLGDQTKVGSWEPYVQHAYEESDGDVPAVTVNPVLNQPALVVGLTSGYSGITWDMTPTALATDDDGGAYSESGYNIFAGGTNPGVTMDVGDEGVGTTVQIAMIEMGYFGLTCETGYHEIGFRSISQTPYTAKSYGAFGSTVLAKHGTADGNLAGAGVTHYTLTAAYGTFTLTGQALDLSAGRTLTSAQGSYTLTGQTVDFKADRRLTAAQGSYALTGQTVDLVSARQFVAAQGSYSLTGQATGLAAGRTLTADQGSYTLNGQAVVLVGDRTLTASQGSYSLNGQTVGITADRTLTAAQGSYSLNGQAIELSAGLTLDAAQGSYSLNGQAVGVTAARALSAAQGSYSLTGQAVDISTDRVLAAAQGSYTLTGIDAGLINTVNVSLVAAGGTYALTGQAIGLYVDRSLTAGQGTYNLNGQAVTFARSRTTIADQGSYALTGQSINLSLGAAIAAAQGNYALTGQAVTLARSRLFAADQGTYNLTGQDVTIAYGHVLVSGQGTYNLTGYDVTILHGAAIEANQGSYSLTGQAVGLYADRIWTAEQGSYSLTGQAVGLAAGFNLTAEQGSYTLTGQSAALIADRTIAAAQGTYNLTGQDILFLTDGALGAEQGSYVINGQAVNLALGAVVAADQGSYALNGQDVTLAYHRTFSAAQGSYTLNGQSVSLSATLGALAAGQGSYALTGQDIDLTLNRALVAAYGSYTLTGQTVGLAQVRSLSAAQGSYALTGQAVNLVYPRNLSATTGYYTLTGQDIEYIYGHAPLVAGTGYYSLTGQDITFIATIIYDVPGERSVTVEPIGRHIAAQLINRLVTADAIKQAVASEIILDDVAAASIGRSINSEKR